MIPIILIKESGCKTACFTIETTTHINNTLSYPIQLSTLSPCCSSKIDDGLHGRHLETLSVDCLDFTEQVRPGLWKMVKYMQVTIVRLHQQLFLKDMYRPLLEQIVHYLTKKIIFPSSLLCYSFTMEVFWSPSIIF